MDNLTQRRVIAVIGILVAFAGLTAFLWGMLKNEALFQLFGFFSILIAYVLMVVVKKLRERHEADKAEGLKVE